MKEILARLDAIERSLSANQRLLSEQVLLKKDVLNFNEACTYLDVSSSYLYKLTSSNQIPHFCPQGKKLYFNRSGLDKWRQRNHREDVARIEKQAINYVIRKRRTAI